MEFIEKYFIIFVALVLAAGFVLIGFYLIRDLLLHKRKAITYENYKEYKIYFSFEPNRLLLILGAVYLAVLVFLSFFVLRNNVLRIYLIVFALMLLFVGTSIALYYLSKRYNKDLSYFDNNYESISNSYLNKQKLLEVINGLNIKRTELQNDIKRIEDSCMNLVVGYSGIVGLPEIVKPLDDIIEAQEGIVNSFDNSMTGLFTKSLIDYLKNGKISKSTYTLFNPMTTIEIENICNSISENKKKIFSAYLVSVFENVQFANNKALVQISNILLNNNLFKGDSYTKIIIEFISNQEQDREDVVEFLYNNNLLNYPILLDCVDKHLDFIFDRSITRCITEKEFIEFISTVVNKNNYSFANKYLVFCTKADCESIKKALEISGAKNKTAELFEGYYHLLQVDSGYNDISTRYENIAITLRDYFVDSCPEKERINHIIHQESYLDNKSTLDAMYNKVLSEAQPVLDKCFNSLLHYFVYGSSCVTQVVESKVKQLFVEYKKSVNIRGLLCLAALLDGLMLINIKDKDKAKTICESILSYNNLCDDFEYYPISANSKKNYVLYGKEILENLYDVENLSILRNVIMHVEKSRQTLDLFRRL